MGRSQLQLSQDQEKRIADMRGGRRHPGSGNQWKHKNDVHEARILWEAKRTGAKQLTIKATDLLQLREEAALTDRIGVLHGEIGDKRPMRFVVMSEDDFIALLDETEHQTPTP